MEKASLQPPKYSTFHGLVPVAVCGDISCVSVTPACHQQDVDVDRYVDLYAEHGKENNL